MEAATEAEEAVAQRPKKISGNNEWFQSSRVPSFAQMLKKNLPVQPSSTTGNPPPATSSSENYSVSNVASKVTQVTGNFPEPMLSKVVLPDPNTVLPPKKIPKEFVMKYKRGEINPVSALHQFAQMQRVQLELKETVTTGNVMGPYFAFCAVVDGIQYQTGLGQNKKESRSNAAKLALDELLQLDDPEPRTVETSGPPLIPAEPVISAESNYVSKVMEPLQSGSHNGMLPEPSKNAPDATNTPPSPFQKEKVPLQQDDPPGSAELPSPADTAHPE